MESSYSKVADFYRLSMKVTGFARGLQKYMGRMKIQLPQNARIFDIGCGTGNLSVAMKRFFPTSRILAADLGEKFLDHIRDEIVRNNFSHNDFDLGIADISVPEDVRLVDEQKNIHLDPETFDVVVVGAALGYAVDPKESLVRLLRLIKPGGYFINIEMTQNFVGSTISNFYHYTNPGIEKTLEILSGNGYVVQQIPFLLSSRLAAP